MPAGCEFICKNEDCQDNGKGFVLTAPWPMGKIELVISELSNQVKLKPSLKDLLDKTIDFKNQGRKYACITFPNVNNIPTVAYRINFWSPTANCIWQYDVEEDEELTIVEAIAKVTDGICPKTGCRMQDFVEVMKNGIECPSCGELFSQSRWFTNENEES